MYAIRDGGTRFLAHGFCSRMSNHDAAKIDHRWNAGDFNAARNHKGKGVQNGSGSGMSQPKEKPISHGQMIRLSPSTGINADAASLEEFQAWLP